MSDVTLAELKKAFEDTRNVFEEHKKTVDAKIAAAKAERSTSDFDEKLEKMNEAFTKAEKVQRDWQRQQEALDAKRAADELEFKTKQLETERKFESRMNRHLLGLGGGSADEEKGNRLLERKAYNNYLRKGDGKLSADEQKVLTVANDSTGGYLAPPTYLAEIIKAAVLYSPMRALVAVRNIGTGELQQPKRTSSAAASWVSEIGTRAETTNPAWGMLKIPVHELMAEARVSMANLEDSAFNLEEQLAQEFAEQFGVSEGAAMVSGNGVGKPLGFLDANAAGPSTPLAFTVSGDAATIRDADDGADGIIGLYHGLKSTYAMNASWLLNRTTLGKVRTLKDSSAAYIWQPALTAGNPATILGAPYTEVPDMPDEGANAFPIAFGDWKRAMVLVDRLEMAITRDPYTVATSGQVKFSARRRVGGQVVLGEAARLLKCST